jgi:hypothetical protein
VRRFSGPRLAALVVAGALLAGGCVPDVWLDRERERERQAELRGVDEMGPEERRAYEREQVQERLRWVEGRGAVLVTAKEKEKIGYEHPEAVLNSGLQRLAMENREQIYSVVQPAVEEQLGRRVELTRIAATFPYRSVSVMYRTVDEPFVAFSAFVDLERDGTVRSASQVSISGIVREAETVDGLYLMAYRDRVDQMREYLATEYPHFAPLPQGYIRARAKADPMFRIQHFGVGPGKYPQVKAARNTIYEAYLERPSRSDAEWRELFEAVDPGFGMKAMVDVMLRDPAVELTEAMGRELADDLVANPLFAGVTAWTINVYSNQLMRDDIKFHDQWMFQVDPDSADPHPELSGPRWWSERIVQGYNIERFADGDER